MKQTASFVTQNRLRHGFIVEEKETDTFRGRHTALQVPPLPPGEEGILLVSGQSSTIRYLYGSGGYCFVSSGLERACLELIEPPESF